MKDHHVIEELSAYIDGEARDPEGIARHLRSCESCARRHMELLKLSSHLRTLPEPEVHPAFLTRVMATVEEQAQAPARRWAPILRLGSAAALVVLAVALLQRFDTQPAPPVEEKVAVKDAVDLDRYLDEDTVTLELARLLDAGVEVDQVAAGAPSLWSTDEDSVDYEDMVEYLAESTYDEDLEYYPGIGGSAYGLVDVMESGATGDLDSLLAGYLGEG